MSDDLISRDAVLKLFATHDGKYLYDAIRELPAIERPKGKWLYHRASNGLVVVKCSECKKTYGFLKTNYCPLCGADMRGDENELLQKICKK